MKKKLLIVVLIVMVLVGFTGCLGGQYTDYFNEEYEANENTVLRVTAFNGQIEIYNWDDNALSLNAIKRSRISQEELDNVDIDVVENADQIEIEALYVGHRTSQPSVDMNIKVPSYVTVDALTTSNGAIIVKDVKGDITALSSNGAINIENVDGYVTATTSNGRIDIKSTTGVNNLQSSNGVINAEIYDFQENISIHTSNGGITLYLNPSLNADVEIETSNGQIVTSGIMLSLTTNEEKHKIGTLGDGGNKITIETSNGDINIYELEM
ncbi:MAG: hypothetical protein BV457_07780 [Thermoplasmata archaeon M9B1D]|nr:MAG: hypothetical protein BV457_07780 [Thermoplasmata archaeon M9B1D]PNX47392.1 MAG: hypothetical protein BV456_11050 [Thermoplasmata archaeon M8B2D]